MPKLLEIERLIEGMILAEPVLNKMGQVMIAKDITLSHKHINILKMWGIKQVCIKNTENDVAEINDPDLIELAKKDLIIKLGWEIDNPFLEEMIELAAQSKFKYN